MCWTDEDYKKAPKWAKVFYIFLSVRTTIFLMLALCYIGLHWGDKSVPMALQDAATCVMGFVGSLVAYIFPYYRGRISRLIRTINEINLNTLKRNHNAQENRRTSNRLFVRLAVVCAVFQSMGIMAYVMFAVAFIKTGKPTFNTVLYQPAPGSVMEIVEQIQFLVRGVWMMSLTTCYFSLYIEFILRISFNFRVLAEEMRQLRRGVDFNEEEKLQKLKSLIKDLNLLYW